MDCSNEKEAQFLTNLFFKYDTGGDGTINVSELEVEGIEKLVGNGIDWLALNRLNGELASKKKDARRRMGHYR